MALHVGVDLVREFAVQFHGMGAGPDQGHVATEHVEELRQLVDARAPQEAAEAGDARVAAGRLSIAGAGFVPHGAELVDLDDIAEAAVTLLPEQHGPGRIEPDGGRDQQEQRRQQQEQCECPQPVEGALDQRSRAGQGRGVEFDDRHAGDLPRHVAEKVEQGKVRDEADRETTRLEPGDQRGAAGFG